MSAFCIFGDSAHSRATLECQKQSEFNCLPTSSGRTRSWSFSVFAAFAVHASRLHIYLAIWTDRAFLHMMGSKLWTCSLWGWAQTKIASAPEGLSATHAL